MVFQPVGADKKLNLMIAIKKWQSGEIDANTYVPSGHGVSGATNKYGDINDWNTYICYSFYKTIILT